MKIKIKPNSIGFNELTMAIVNRFPEYRIWEMPRQRLLAEKSRFVGCYISLYKKSIVVIGTFPSLKKSLFALLITILGGIIIPLMVYYIFFYDEFREIENKISNYIKTKFADRLK